MTGEVDLKDLIKSTRISEFVAHKRKRNDSESLLQNKQIDENFYPYEVTDDDHCETPLQAYEHISYLLSEIAFLLNKTIAELIIYDPFYCEGSVVGRLRSLGFESVYNVKEDFYQVHNENRFPDYDVMVTNPPYSGSNMEKILRVCAVENKPWFLLLPNYVYTKDYFPSILKLNKNPVFYVVPTKSRYLYTTPKVLKSLFIFKSQKIFIFILFREEDKVKVENILHLFQHSGIVILPSENFLF
jgi:hypothetical protein